MRQSNKENRDEAARNIALTMKRMLMNTRLLLEAELASEGLTLAQLRMLSALNDTPRLSSAELARACFVTPQSMQALVVRGEREGWIIRSPLPGNQRILTATLTAKGRRVFQHGKECWDGLARQMWTGTSLDEMRTLHGILSVAVDRLQPMIERMHAKQTPV